MAQPTGGGPKRSQWWPAGEVPGLGSAHVDAVLASLPLSVPLLSV